MENNDVKKSITIGNPLFNIKMSDLHNVVQR